MEPKGRQGEVDFLINDYDSLSILPIEVKSGKDYSVHSALNSFLQNKDYSVSNAIVLSNERKVTTTSKGITYMPVYYVMFLDFAGAGGQDVILPELEVV